MDAEILNVIVLIAALIAYRYFNTAIHYLARLLPDPPHEDEQLMDPLEAEFIELERRVAARKRNALKARQAELNAKYAAEMRRNLHERDGCPYACSADPTACIYPSCTVGVALQAHLTDT